jgi:hypothetical protein
VTDAYAAYKRAACLSVVSILQRGLE